MKLAAMIGVAGLLLISGDASAWNLRGHMVVAAIAWDQLTPAAKARAVALLRLNPNYAKWTAGVAAADKGRVAFVRAAGWADDIKSNSRYSNDTDLSSPAASQNVGYGDRRQHRYWHYIDLPFSQDGTPVVQPLRPNAETQIKTFRDTLSSSAPDQLKSYDLVWLLHLVGDVHQPLHATQRFSHDLPRGDRGGNEVALCRKPCRSELHAFWDGALGSGSSPKAAITAARAIAPAPANVADNRNVYGWITESFDSARTAVYRPPVGPGRGPYTLSAAYKRNAKTIANQRAAAAGARLATMLNDRLR